MSFEKCETCGHVTPKVDKPETAVREFKQGKYYRHTTSGRLLAIVGRAKTTAYGECFVGEDPQQGKLLPVMAHALQDQLYTEITRAEWVEAWHDRKPPGWVAEQSRRAESAG